MKAGVMENGLRVRIEEDSPQGGPLSPLLANIHLNEYDKEMARRACLSFGMRMTSWFWRKVREQPSGFWKAHSGILREN